MYKDNSLSSDRLGDDASWSTIIWNRLTRVLRTHAFKVDLDRMFKTATNTSEPDLNSNIVQGEFTIRYRRGLRGKFVKFDSYTSSHIGRRRRHRHRHHMMPMMMLGLMLLGSVFIPMGFQFLAVLGGKALILAKMALILSSIQGLKKIATSGINYGLYHSPIEAWHDRSHQVFPEEEAERYPVYMPPQHR